LRPTWIVDRFWHLMQHGDAASLEALLAPDCRLYENGELVADGRDRGVERLLAIQSRFSELAVSIHERVAAGMRVRERWTVAGRAAERDGALRPALVIHGASWTVCRASCVVEIRQWWDELSLQRQLADAPPLAPPIPAAFERPRSAPSAS
jgi:hypothetical protein